MKNWLSKLGKQASLLAALTLLITFSLYAQNFDQVYSKIQDDVEELEGTESSEDEMSDTYYRLEKLFHNPVNVNTEGAERLGQVPFLTEIEIQGIIELRTRGEIESLQSLLEEGVMDDEMFDKVKYFLRVEGEGIVGALPFRITIENKFAVRSDDDGATLIAFRNLSNIAAGEEFAMPFATSHSFQFIFKDIIEANFVIQHDQFEKSYIDLLKYSALLDLPIMTIAGGALNIAFGQNILFSTASSKDAKSTTSFMTYKKSSKLDLSRGTAENYLNGAGIKAYFSDLSLLAFWGMYNYDAEVISNTHTMMTQYVENVSDSGSERTSSENYAKKNTQYEHVIGVNLDYNFGKLSHVGAAFTYNIFKHPIKPEISEDTIFDFYGKKYLGFSVHANVTVEKANVTLFGDFTGSIVPDFDHPAMYDFQEDIPKGFYPAFIAGVNVATLKNFKYFISARYYSAKIPDFHNRAFEAGQNEMGLYQALDWDIVKTRLKFRIFGDIYKNLYRESSSVSTPRIYKDIGAQLRFRTYRRIYITARQRAKFEGKESEYKTTVELETKEKHFRFRAVANLELQASDYRAYRVSTDMKMDLDIIINDYVSIQLDYEIFKRAYDFPGTASLDMDNSPYYGNKFGIIQRYWITQYIGLDIEWEMGFHNDIKSYGIDRVKTEKIQFELKIKI